MGFRLKFRHWFQYNNNSFLEKTVASQCRLAMLAVVGVDYKQCLVHLVYTTEDQKSIIYDHT